MRYSTDTGYKNLPDNGENGSRGFAIRFVLSDDGHTHYDIITNNAYGFVVGTGEGFLDQFKAMRDGKMDDFLEKYPHAKYFMENQLPAHAYSFATEQWHATHAFKFTNAEGKERYFRWRLVPWQGVMKHSKADAAKQSKNFQSKILSTVFRATSRSNTDSWRSLLRTVTQPMTPPRSGRRRTSLSRWVRLLLRIFGRWSKESLQVGNRRVSSTILSPGTLMGSTSVMIHCLKCELLSISSVEE